MQRPELHQAAPRPAPARHRHYRGVALLVACTLVLVSAATGIAASFASRSSSAPQARGPSVAASARTGVATVTRQPPADQPIKPVTPISQVLADGTYATYIRNVDVRGARITVDVVQLFENDAAVTAAIEDGKSPSEAQGLYVYIRNQNGRLRTLAIARHVRVSFADGCDVPPDRKSALTELAKATAQFTSLYYYDITVRDGAIRSVTQKLAEAAC